MALSPFHLAVPVNDLTAARAFYGDLLGCPEGRSSTKWIDYDLFGHQFVVHLQEEMDTARPLPTNAVDDHAVPIPHFGVVLDWEDWEDLAQKLKVAGQHFIIEPYIRFKGQVGEQATMFFQDPAGNALEFKAFKDISQLFAK
ncbi:MAG: VOC family protein [Bacteroidota bacterium]